MTDRNLLVEHGAHGVVRVTLNRPDVLNAFDEALIARLDETFCRLDADPTARVVVLAATGRAFCAGADIEWMRRAAANDRDTNLEDARRFAQMMSSIDTCSKPVVARVQGVAYGGGVGLACAADIAIASTRARFAVSEAKFGILPAVIGPYVINAVGLRQARRLALTCSVIDADEAQLIGLVHQVAAEPDLDAAVNACVSELLKSGPSAMSEIKRLFAELEVGPVTPQVRELTAQTISRVRTGAEAREGFDAFLAKRAAAWAVVP
jgi:methylglutaconyl-CoA hydratase